MSLEKKREPLLKEQSNYGLNEEDLRIIESRKKDILKGEEKVYTAAQLKKKLLKNLGK